jgi:hypothetical protein
MDKFEKTNFYNRTLPAVTIARDQVHEGGERPAQNLLAREPARQASDWNRKPVGAMRRGE